MKNSYLKMRVITALVALAMAVLPFISSAQVIVHLTILPPYSTKLSDYFSRPQQVLLMVQNTSATLQNVQLRGEFTGDNGVSIRADQNYKSASPVRLGPNETRTLGINDIAALFNINEVTFTGITKEQFIRQNGVPDGNYQICVQAYDYYTNKSLSGAAPAGCSNIFPVSSVEDPTVIAPYDGQTVSALAGQNFVISWSTPAGAPPSTQYTVKIVQIFDGKSPADAFNTAGIPIFFQQTVTGSNSLVYGPAMPALTLGRHYAMAVTASDPMNSVTFKNHGQSVISSFIYGDTAAILKTKTPVTQRIGGLPGEPIIIGTPIPVATIQGSMSWYFEPTEENAPIGRVPAQIPPPPHVPGTVAHPVANTRLFVQVLPLYASTSGGGASQLSKAIWNKNQDNTVNGDRENDLDVDLEDEIYNGSSFTTTTDANGNFTFSMSGILEAISQNPKEIMKRLGFGALDSLKIIMTSSQVVNGTLSSTFGNYTRTFSPNDFTTGISLGAIKAVAGTFRYKPTVVDGNGHELTDATINVYRRADFYNGTNQQLQYEGNYNANTLPRQQVVLDGVNYVKVASLHSGNTATRLFFQQPGDSYKIQIDEGDYTTLYADLSATTADLNASFTQQRTYSMATAPTLLTGTVYQKLNGISVPAKGAVVNMLTNNYMYIGRTDTAGNFTLQTGYNIVGGNPPVSPIQALATPQNLFVQYNGQTAVSSVMMDKAGKTYTTQITFETSTYPVKGRIVDESNNPIPNPVIRWQSTGQYVPADETGAFSTSNVVGRDSLLISKLGYADRHYGVTISADGAIQLNAAAAPATGRSVSKIVMRPLSGASTFINAINGNVGNITLDKEQGRINLYVTDQNGKALPGALVNIQGTPLPQDAVADQNGMVSIIGPSGNVTFDVKGPAGSTCVPAQAVYLIPGDNSLETVRFALQSGVKLTGKVTANGSPVEGAVVGMYDQGYGTVMTGNDGSYAIIEPPGSYQLEASKQGYLADIKNGNYSTSQTVNFALTTSGVSITKLLGFNVEVDEIKPNGSGKLISGKFINLPSNPVFSVASGTSIRFQDVAVTVQADGTAIPTDNIIYTTQTGMSLKAFGYMPIVADNGDSDGYNDVIWIAKRGADGKHGQMMCAANFDLSSFMPPGIPNYLGAEQVPVYNNTSDPSQVALLTDDGSLPGNGAIAFKPGSNLQFNIYGFKMNAAVQHCQVQPDGIHIGGNIDFGNIPVLSSSNFTVQALIGKDGLVSSVTAQPGLTLNLAGWKGTVNSLSFNENGFMLGGSLTVQMPGSSASTVNFNNLQIAKDQVYGGSFTFPAQGVDVFNTAKISASGISFGKLGNSNTYYLSATKSSIGFTGAAGNYIDPINLQQLQLQTDGKFVVSAQTDIHNSFFGGVAKLDVNELGISDVNNEPNIDIKGDFGLTIPGATATAGGIHIKSGGRISVDNLGFGFDVAGIAKANVNIGFQNSKDSVGFAGSGDFNVAGFADIGVGFSYFKVKKGIDLSTSFSTSTYIPLGTSGLSVTQLGGGFAKMANDDSWKIDINGTVSVGYQAFANANIDFSISNGPIVEGSAKLNIANMSGLANGHLKISVPDKYFNVSFDAGVNMLGISGSTAAQMTLSLDHSDPYYMIGMNTQASAFGVITLSGGVIGAYNLDMNKHRSEVSNYFDPAHLPPVGPNGKFSGLSMYTEFDENLTDVLPNFNVDLGLIGLGVHSYFDMGFYGYLSANLADNNPRLSAGFGVHYNMGGDVEFKALDVIDWHAGLAIGFNADFAGTVSIHPNSLTMSAQAGALFHAYCGDISPGYCTTGTNIFDLPPYEPEHWWVSVCLSPQLHIDYSTQNGFKFSFR